jgi:BON domain
MYEVMKNRWPFASRRSSWRDMSLFGNRHSAWFGNRHSALKDASFRQWFWTLGGVGIGAGLMYMLDPDRGRRRRALMRDKIVRGVNETGRAIGSVGTVSRDLGNRARGVLANARSRIKPEEVPDDILESRVRSQLGHVVLQPGEIFVTADDGHVTLSGSVRSEEVDQLISRISSLPGVFKVSNLLRVQGQAGGYGGGQDAWS